LAGVEKKRFSVKVFVVQHANGDVLAAKLTFQAAHAIAKACAPCRVIPLVADKEPDHSSK
jgi:hypothetical protein